MNRYLRQTLREIAQTDPAVGTDPRFLLAKAAADGELPPMSFPECVRFACQKAAVRAEDERKRLPQPQLELVR